MSDAKQNGFKCGMTGKRRFKSHGHALNKIKAIMAEADSPQKLSAYQCEFCGGWHLTKK